MHYEIQLQWIRALQHVLRTPWMDGFFRAWNYVDSQYFVLGAIILVWYLWDRRIGIRLFYILVIGSVFIQFLKGLFHLPRPCQIDPSVGLLCFTSFGFPSGAAQLAAVISGVLFLECKRTLYRWLGLLFALFLCFSRVYLGVHYPIDILGGLASGCVLLLLYAKVFPLFEKHWKVWALCFPFFLLLLKPVFSLSWYLVVYLCFSSLGLAAGLITYEKKDNRPAKSLALRWAQVFSVLAGVIILFVLESKWPLLDIAWAFAEGYWVSFLGGWPRRVVN